MKVFMHMLEGIVSCMVGDYGRVVLGDCVEVCCVSMPRQLENSRFLLGGIPALLLSVLH